LHSIQKRATQKLASFPTVLSSAKLFPGLLSLREPFLPPFPFQEIDFGEVFLRQSGNRGNATGVFDCVSEFLKARREVFPGHILPLSENPSGNPPPGQ
jgi:hypothetical protein